MAAMPTNGWRGWVLGIVATLIVGAITNGIVFQRDTREVLARHSDEIKHLQMRDENIIKYLQQFADQRSNTSDAAILRLEKRMEELERRR